MASTESTPTAARCTRSASLAAVGLVGAALIGVVGVEWAGPSLALSFLATRGEAAGAVRHGLTVFDSSRPAVANLDPDLLRALRQAARDAARDGVEIVIRSGWRSPEYQARRTTPRSRR